jgi:glycosyltransferase involved in cell wall biosynthesis
VKILLCSYWALPMAGGIWTYVRQLLEGLERRGHDVELLTRRPDRQVYYLLRSGRTLSRSAVEQPLRRAVRARFADSWIAHYEIKRYGFELAALYFGLEGYDLLHAQDVIAARAISRIQPAGVPLVTTLHGSLTQELRLQGTLTDAPSQRGDYLSALERAAGRHSERLIVPSRWMKELAVRDLRVPPAKTSVVPYGLNLGHFSKPAATLKGVPTAAPQNQILLCPARLDRVKGHAVLLQALALLNQRRQDWVCWLVGDGAEKSRLQRLARDLRLQERVLFLGTRQDVPALLAQANLFVLPSLMDNHPYAVMEAQAAGRAIVTTRTGGIPEMVTHGETGLLADAGDAAGLAEQLHRLLRDRRLQDKLGRQARAYAAGHWSLDAMVERTLGVYEQAGGGEP